MNLYEKIAAVMQSITYLVKDTQVQFNTTKYSAISEENVTKSVRKHLIEQGIVIVPIQINHHREGTLSTVDVTYRIQNVEDPDDFILAVSSGTGADSQDKGVGKAMTYAYKYLLLRMFAIPTGNDPDSTPSDELDEMLPATNEEQQELYDMMIRLHGNRKGVKEHMLDDTGYDTFKVIPHREVVFLRKVLTTKIEIKEKAARDDAPVS